MKLKINRYEFNVTNKDWILDNGACYQCMTLTHPEWSCRNILLRDTPTKMSRKQFKQLVKDGILVEVKNTNVNKRYPECRIWKFNVEEENGIKEN